MIIDSLENHKRYEALHPRFAKAFNYLASADLSNLPEGRIEIDGGEIYLTMNRGALKEPQYAPIEVHNRYIDIQVVIEGAETFGWKSRGELASPRGEYDAENDIRFFNDAPTTFYTLHAGEMSVFFPEDGHAPMIGNGNVVKCIVKILA